MNTMVAAYNAGTKAPSVFFRDDNGNTIDSVYMMYDAANKMILDRSNKIQVDLRLPITTSCLQQRRSG